MARVTCLFPAFLALSVAQGPLFSWQDAATAGKLKNRKQQEQPKQPQKEDEPPEEDEGLKQKEYSFNPLQAAKEMRAGAFYAKKGNHKAAARRFREATKWDPTSAEAFLRLAQSEVKLKDENASREAYAKYLELAPDAKNAESIRKKIGSPSGSK